MKIRFLLLLGLLTGWLVPAFANAGPTPSAPCPLILISIDGFRWDYLEKFSPPHLRQLAREGVHAKKMIPSFPTLTFPNHYTIVTGLHPEHHGIVANTFFDPVLKEKFIYKSHESAVDPHWWSAGEPIWITAEKQGVRSACFFWPGSETEIHGTRPTLFKPFDKSLTCTERVDGLLAWLDLPPGQRPRCCTLYFDLVDTKGHLFGPDAPETAAAVKEVDEAIGRLLAGLDQRALRTSANLVVVSDHGMEPLNPEQLIFLDDYADLKTFEIDYAGPNAGLRPRTGTAAELVTKFKGKHPQLSAWVRAEVPEALHYRTNDRIAPVVLSAAPGWFIISRDFMRIKKLTLERGAHGYDPASPNMGALFLASGPAFQRGKEIAPVENIHIYNLLCAALALKPAPNDGDDRLVRAALKH